MINTTPHTQLNPIGQLRERLFYLMLATLLAVVIVTIVALLLYIMPPTSDIYVGELEQFPPANTPYALTLPDGQPIFLVNDGKPLIALSGIGTHLFNCRLIWRKPFSDQANPNVKEQFEDPCAGGGFALSGGYLGGPSPRDMDRLKLRVDEAHRVYVDPQTRLVDSKDEIYARCMGAQQWLYGNKPVRYESKVFCKGYANSHVLPQGAF